MAGHPETFAVIRYILMSMSDPHDIVIVGAGAAGLAAGIAAGQAVHEGLQPRIVLLDGSKQFGTKVLMAGGGRCNLTHDRVSPEDYNGSHNIVRNILAGFDQQATVRWFEDLGVPLHREETGKLFPVSNSAQSVLDALVGRCSDLGVAIHGGHRVREILPPDGGVSDAEAFFTLRHERGDIQACRVILCTGGRSWPATGSDGQGLELARALGHTVTDLHPALVPLVLDSRFFHEALTGIAHEAEVSVFVEGKRVCQQTGSLLWTHFGVSGPVVLDVSRQWVIAHVAGKKVEVRCSLVPGSDFAGADHWLTEQALASPHRRIDNLLAKRLPRRLAESLVRHCHVPADTSLSQLRREHRRDLVHGLVELPLPVIGHRGWEAAEVTAGGVPLQEIDYRTMQSRKVRGLYLAGEMLDCDGRLGGFNLQWAWSTGHIAGRSAVRSEIGH